MAQRPEEETSADATRGEMGDFAKRLKAAREEAGLDDKPPEPPPPFGLAAYALRLATELVAGVIVGGFIGWWIDRRFGTSPIALIACFALGTAAGAWNVVLAVRRMNARIAAHPPPAPVADEDED